MDPLSFTLFNISGRNLFIIVFVVLFIFFVRTIIHRLRLLLAASPKDRFDRIGERLLRVIRIAFGQKKILRFYRGAGLGHAFIFWGFCVVSIRTITLMGIGFDPTFRLPFMSGGFEAGYSFMKDLFEILVLIGVTAAAYRRLILKPDRLGTSFEGVLILIWIFILMITDLVFDGSAMALSGEFHSYAPVGAFIGKMLVGLDRPSMFRIMSSMYFIHVTLILLFLNYLPYGKHFHVITAIPNVFFSRLDPPGRLQPLDVEKLLEEDKVVGVKDITDMSWKDILDIYTCTQCGRCQDNCPAYLTNKPLSPKKLNKDMLTYLYKKAPAILNDIPEDAEKAEEKAGEFTGGAISEDVIWACTTCRSCEEQCPVCIEFVQRIVNMRRYLVTMESRFPKELTSAFKGMETNFNPWGLGSNKRMDWAEQIDEEVPVLAEKGSCEYLFFVGCAGSYDDRYKKITQKIVKILNRCGIDYAVLGEEEVCTGDSANRAGHEYLFQILAKQNIDTFNRYGVKKIITNCPHCYNTIKNEYPAFGGNYEVYHLSELLPIFIKNAGLKVNTEELGKITVHDSCYLGRYNGIFEEPRKVIRMGDTVPVEMERNYCRSLCCGAGGARMWLEEPVEKRVNALRLKDVEKTGADTVVTSCPFCYIMFDDAIKQSDKEESIRVKDLVELIEV